jgi:hypothetical protein
VIAAAGVLAALITWLFARSWDAPPVERATLASVAFVPLWSGLALAGLIWNRRARPGHARRSLFALHRQLGGALAVVAMLLFGSGVAAVLDRSLASWQVRPEAAHVEVLPASEQALDQAIAELLRVHPELGQADLALHPADADHPWIQADFFDGDRKPVRVDLDPQTGAVLARGQGPLWVLRELHRRLLLQPVIGESVLGLLGLCLGLVLLSGLATRRWLRARRSTSKQPTSMRLHQWLGLSLLPAATLWAWSGALLGLTLLIVPIVGGAAYDGDRAALMHDVLAVDRPPLEAREMATPSLREVVTSRCASIDEHLPDAEVHRVILHHPTQASATIRVDLESPGLFTRASFTVGGDGSLRDCRALPAAGIGLKSFMAAIVLHYGEWEGDRFPRVLVDVAYLLLGTALVALAWLGGCLLARRRERDGDLPGALRLRRWLTSVGLGLCLVAVGLAVQSRIPAIGRSEPVALLVAAGLTIAVTLCMFSGALQARRRWLMLALAVGLWLIPTVGWLAAGVVPGVVEAICIIVALALAVAATNARRQLAAD